MGTNASYNGVYTQKTDPDDSWNMNLGNNKEDLTWLL